MYVSQCSKVTDWPFTCADYHKYCQLRRLDSQGYCVPMLISRTVSSRPGEENQQHTNGKSDDSSEPATKRQETDEQPKEILEEGRIYFLYRSGFQPVLIRMP